MAYVTIPENKKEQKQFSNKKKVFFKWVPGVHKIRLLDEHIEPVYVHWVGGVYVKCLGDTCPICQNNFRIMKEDENYRKNGDFHPRTVRFYTNILDLTPVKVCPKCGNENHKREDGTWPDACTNCGNMLSMVEPSPSNTVKIMSKGVQLFSQFNTFEEIYGQPPTAYNIALIVKNSREVSASAIPNENQPVEVSSEDLYNLPDDAIIELNAEELVQLASGVRLRDIFTARSKKKEYENTPKLDTDIAAEVEALFNNS